MFLNNLIYAWFHIPNGAVLDAETMEPSIQVKIIAVDFTSDASIYRQMAAELADLDIGVLINNVGMCDNFCEPFAEIGSEQVIDDLITCNVVSVPRMTHMVLPGMLRRRRGVIINIGSIAGAVSTPLGTLYGATKVGSLSIAPYPLSIGLIWGSFRPWFYVLTQAFVNKFSRDLGYELRGSGVIVQTVVPGFVLTNMVKSNTRLESSFSVPNADEYVVANLRTLGLESYTASFWAHKIQVRS